VEPRNSDPNSLSTLRHRSRTHEHTRREAQRGMGRKDGGLFARQGSRYYPTPPGARVTATPKHIQRDGRGGSFRFAEEWQKQDSRYRSLSTVNFRFPVVQELGSNMLDNASSPSEGHSEGLHDLA
jgi:hypothetical protein